MCSGKAPELEEETSFVGRWIEILRPGYDRVIETDAAPEELHTALEKEAVIVSLENLMTFPFVQEAVDSGELSLHGLWTEIGDGILQEFSSKTREFTAI